MKPENPPETAARFPAVARVRAKADYARVFEHGKRTADPLLVLHRLPGESPARLGLAVSRKVSPRAVVRNRIKRALREQFRSLRPRLAAGDCVVVARSAAAAVPPARLREAFARALVRAGALPDMAATMPPSLNSPSSHTNKPDADAG